MKRYQVLLETQHVERLKALANEQHRSVASVLRQALDIGLAAMEQVQRQMAGGTPLAQLVPPDDAAEEVAPWQM